MTKLCLYNYVTKPRCYFIFLIHTAQLLDRNSKTHKSIGRKVEFRETNFRDGANFNNFRGIWFRNVDQKLPKQIPRLYFFSKVSVHQKFYQSHLLNQSEKLIDVKRKLEKFCRYFDTISWSSRSQMCYIISVLKISQNFTRKHLF